MPNNKEYPFGQDWFHVKQMENDIWAIREPNHSEDVSFPNIVFTNWPEWSGGDSIIKSWQPGILEDLGLK